MEEIVEVFDADVCSTPREEDYGFIETGTFTAFSKEPFFQISLVRTVIQDDDKILSNPEVICISQP